MDLQRLVKQYMVFIEAGRIPTDVAERIAADVNHLLFSASKMKVRCPSVIWG